MIYLDIHSILYFEEVKIDNVTNITYVAQYGDKLLVKEFLRKITANASKNMFLGIANNFGSSMLNDKVKINHGGDVLACGSPSEIAPDPKMDDYFDIKNNNIVCMGCMDLHGNYKKQKQTVCNINQHAA